MELSFLKKGMYCKCFAHEKPPLCVIYEVLKYMYGLILMGRLHFDFGFSLPNILKTIPPTTHWRESITYFYGILQKILAQHIEKQESTDR